LSHGRTVKYKEGIRQHGFQTAKTSSAEFVTELNKSQQLRERLDTTVAELKKTIALMEQNL
jgi:hypothetical protein